MAQVAFRDWFFNKFLEWEKTQPGRRSNQTVFARWLSDNKYGVLIKQQLVSYWIKGPYEPSDEDYVLVLSEKLGDEIYEILNIPRPDPFLLYAKQAASRLNDKQKKKITEQIVEYLAENEKRTSKP